MKLTGKQISDLGAVLPELADKLEAGESVTVEREVKRWQPKYSVPDIMNRREVRAAMRLLAYREEFAPGYEVPEIGETTWCIGINGTAWRPMPLQSARCPTDVYMPEDVARELVRKLNSGEVVL